MYRFYGHGSQMSADLKLVIRRVRAAHPEYFEPRFVPKIEIDEKGNASTKVVRDVRAIAPTPRDRHRLSLQTERF